MPDIILKKLSYSFIDKKYENKVLNDIDLVFPSNEISVILGPSGSGKTTLLRCILGLENKYEGEIFINEVNAFNIPTKDRNASYVPQSFSLYPHMNLFDNIAYPLKLMGANKDEIKQRVFEITEKANIKHLLSRKPKQVSLGELQRASLCRAIVKRPDICLLDEPFSNLDNKTRNEMRLWTRKIFKELGTTVIFVTHSMNDATALGDHIFVLEKGQIVYKNTPEGVANDHSPIIKSYFDEDE